MDLEVSRIKALELVLRMSNKEFNMAQQETVMNEHFGGVLELFKGNGDLAAGTLSNLIKRPDVEDIPALNFVLSGAVAAAENAQQFADFVKRPLMYNLVSGVWEFQLEGGAPKCMPCSTNEVYKPPKKKSIRKKNKKRKTNKKSKKKIIKKSPKYSKRKSIKKKSFKKSSKRNTLKKSKRKNKK